MACNETTRLRLDNALVAQGLVRSRSHARDLIKRGFVEVDGQRARKASVNVSRQSRLCVNAEAPSFVSRGGEKLAAALDHFGFDAKGCVALDVGASTGGFTEVLLARGAAHVYAVDVGRGQLDPGLARSARVASFEGLDARNLTAQMFDRQIYAIVVDVSFVSLTKVLPSVLTVAGANAWLICLVKPQFEVGRDKLGKNGIVRDEDARRDALAAVENWLIGQSRWRVLGTMVSPITGGSGNVEFLIGAQKCG